MEWGMKRECQPSMRRAWARRGQMDYMIFKSHPVLRVPSIESYTILS